jgi:hypothetical protein
LRIWTDNAKSPQKGNVHTYLGTVGAGSSVSHGKDSPALVLQSKVLIRESSSVDGLAYIQIQIDQQSQTGQIPNNFLEMHPKANEHVSKHIPPVPLWFSKSPPWHMKEGITLQRHKKSTAVSSAYPLRFCRLRLPTTRTCGKKIPGIRIPFLRCTKHAIIWIYIRSCQQTEDSDRQLLQSIVGNNHCTHEILDGLGGNISTKLKSDTPDVFAANFHIKED